jgi:hypothetical protein
MRTLIRIAMNVERTNSTIRDGGMPKLIEDAVARLKPEAAYFYAEHGKRCAMFVCDLQDQSDIPVIAEPFFQQTGATVEITPVMNLDDLKSGLNKAMAASGAGEYTGASL